MSDPRLYIESEYSGARAGLLVYSKSFLQSKPHEPPGFYLEIVSWAMEDGYIRDQLTADRVRQFAEFLDPHDHTQKSYADAIKLMINRQERRLIVSLDDIRTYTRELADGSVVPRHLKVVCTQANFKESLLNEPFEYLPPLDEALKQTVKTLNDGRMAISRDTLFYCALTGSFGEYAVNPRMLGSKHLNHLVSLDGIVSSSGIK